MAAIRVLGCDPGKHNFGWAIYSDGGLERHDVIEGAATLDGLPAWRKRFIRLVTRWRPDACAIERYMRRLGKGAIKEMEVMNIMIGLSIEICTSRGIPCLPVAAATHKGWTARNFEVEPVKRKAAKRKATTDAKKQIVKKWDIGTYREWRDLPTSHEVDAANLAKYGHDVVFAQ